MINKKAQNLIEYALVIAVVAVVTMSTWTVFGNMKTNLKDLTKSNIVETAGISGAPINDNKDKKETKEPSNLWARR